MQVRAGDASIGFVSTYPPTVCGLASYTTSLINAIAGDRRSRSGLGVVSLTERTGAPNARDVVFHHRTGNASSLATAARLLNRFDSVSIQHEFGIFGGADGDEVVELMSELTVPTAVTFHTVLEHPTVHQRAIVDHLIEHADRMVVMSETASQRLVHRYGADPGRIAVIPHGADGRLGGPSLVTGDRPLVLTWGLIGPGKGLETAIESFADLRGLDPRPRYLIAGATHPHVRETDGESYREGLVAMVDRLGLGGLVEFDDRYRDRSELARLVRSADVVVLPYASLEQVTSGVLVEAIAAGKPVVATRFPHAVELLSGGAGITVPHGDHAAMAVALRRLLTEHGLLSEMARRARRMADGWYWPVIGRRFGNMMSDLAGAGGIAASSAQAEVFSVAG